MATIAYSGQTALWNVAEPRHPVKMTTLSDGDGTKLEELAFSPDSQILATARYDKIFLRDMASPAPDGHTPTVVVDRAEMSANSGRDTIFDWPVTSTGILSAVTVAARDVADFQPVIAPGDRTVLGSPPDSHAWQAWALP